MNSETRARNHALLCCATAHAHAAQTAALELALAAVTDFDAFVSAAEREGIAPLVALHAARSPSLPPTARALLLGFASRHTLAARARWRALEQALRALKEAGVEALFTKGAAVAWLAYPAPELRAMRDVDMLVDEADLEPAARALANAGFGSRNNAPPGCHEVYTIDRVIDGFSVRIDMHRRVGLFELPSYAPGRRQTLAELRADAQTFQLGGEIARAPGRADLLRIVHRHGFALGLYERYRLNAVADLATLAERWREVVDWRRLQREDAVTFAAVRLLAKAVPLSDELRATLAIRETSVMPSAGERYEGVFSAGEPPRTRLREQLRTIARLPSAERAAVFWGYRTGPLWPRLVGALRPPHWWMRMRHGRPTFLAWLAHLLDVATVARRRWRGEGNVRR